MKEKDVLEILGRVNAVIANSHMVYTSERHGKAYVNKDALYPHTDETSRLCHAIAERFKDDHVEVVIAPAVGGVILSQWTAYHLTEMKGYKLYGSSIRLLVASRSSYEVLGVYAEKEKVSISDPEGRGRKCFVETGNFIIKRGYDNLIAGKNVLVVEDVLTTGSSAKKVIEATRVLGGNVVGLGVLYNRGGITPADVASPPRLFALINVKFESWEEDDCPLCKQGIPINTDVGKGREYLAKKAQ